MTPAMAANSLQTRLGPVLETARPRLRVPGVGDQAGVPEKPAAWRFVAARRGQGVPSEFRACETRVHRAGGMA